MTTKYPTEESVLQDDGENFELDLDDLNLTSEDIDFDEIDDDLERFQEDEMVQQALQRGVDLRKYGQELAAQLKEVSGWVTGGGREKRGGGGRRREEEMYVCEREREGQRELVCFPHDDRINATVDPIWPHIASIKSWLTPTCLSCGVVWCGVVWLLACLAACLLVIHSFIHSGGDGDRGAVHREQHRGGRAQGPDGGLRHRAGAHAGDAPRYIRDALTH
jgi:hypothetical protein